MPEKSESINIVSMDFPKFLLGDNTDYPDAIFIIHTEFPRFIINLENDEVEWLEDFDADDEKELSSEAEGLIQQANDFYDREISRYDE
jgi:hypothetical protein